MCFAKPLNNITSVVELVAATVTKLTKGPPAGVRVPRLPTLADWMICRAGWSSDINTLKGCDRNVMVEFARRTTVRFGSRSLFCQSGNNYSNAPDAKAGQYSFAIVSTDALDAGFCLTKPATGALSLRIWMNAKDGYLWKLQIDTYQPSSSLGTTDWSHCSASWVLFSARNWAAIFLW